MFSDRICFQIPSSVCQPLFILLSHFMECILRPLIIQFLASPAFWNTRYVTPPHPPPKKILLNWKEKKDLGLYYFFFFFLSYLVQMLCSPDSLTRTRNIGMKRSSLHKWFLFKLLFSCPLSRTWHKRVRLVFARAVLFVSAWLLIWALYSVDWEERLARASWEFSIRWTRVSV